MENLNHFDDAYQNWQEQCLSEFNCCYGERRLYYAIPDKYPDDYEPDQLVEFSKDGSAYPHGIGGTGHISKAVTPWSESEFFVL